MNGPLYPRPLSANFSFSKNCTVGAKYTFSEEWPFTAKFTFCEMFNFSAKCTYRARRIISKSLLFLALAFGPKDVGSNKS